MMTLLKKTALHDLLNQPVLFDANIFMVGISNRLSDKNCLFENIKQLYLQPMFESFTDIYIHDEVFKELDEESKVFVDSYRGRNVTIVDEGGLYGRDPRYTMIFNNIAGHELIKYVRGRAKDRGEVYSLAYAAYHNMNFFCSKDIMADHAAHELEDLRDVEIITFDIIVLSAYVYYARRGDNSHSKGLKSLYKTYCADVIKRHGLPPTLGEYIKAVQDYL